MLMRRPTANNQKRALGLTLLEIVVTLAVLAVIAALVGKPIVNLVESRLRIGEAAARQADIDYALTRLATQIRQSDRDTDIICTQGPTAQLAVTVDGSTTRYQRTGRRLVIDSEATDEILIGDLDNENGFTCRAPGAGLRLYEVELKTGDRRYQATAFKRQP